jgi:hypothetical protein
MKFLADTATQTWSQEGEELSSFSANLYFGFRNNGELPVTFDGMGFGYTLENSEGLISEDHNPLEGVTYISSDQDYITAHTINDLVPDEEYTLNVWAENSGNRWEEEFSFTLLRPTSPFDSWIYNEENHAWEAPILYPEDDGMYAWDEESQEWVAMDNGI